MTKHSAAVFLMAAGLMVTTTCALRAADQDKAADAKTPPVKTIQPTPIKPTPIKPATIPKDAVRNGDGSFTWTDKKGAKWLYRKTPFGVSKTSAVKPETQTGSQPQPKTREVETDKGTELQRDTPFGTTKTGTDAKSNPPVKAVEAGDVVRFERKTPFGISKWEKKKSELTDDERKILAQQNAKPADPHKAEKSE
jgi:hypothetical protein